MATVAARRDDPAVVVFLIGPETRQRPDEAAEDERPRRGALLLFRKEGSEGILCPRPGRGHIAAQLVVWFARARGCEHDCTLSLPMFSLIPWCLFFCAAAGFFYPLELTSRGGATLISFFYDQRLLISLQSAVRHQPLLSLLFSSFFLFASVLCLRSA